MEEKTTKRDGAGRGPVEAKKRREGRRGTYNTTSSARTATIKRSLRRNFPRINPAGSNRRLAGSQGGKGSKEMGLIKKNKESQQGTLNVLRSHRCGSRDGHRPGQTRDEHRRARKPAAFEEHWKKQRRRRNARAGRERTYP